MVVKMIIIGSVCFFIGLMLGVMLMAVVSIDRVNRERRGNTYE